MSEATFQPDDLDDKRSILRWTRGTVITPFVGRSRVVMLVNEQDEQAIDSLLSDGGPDTVRITDQMTDDEHTIKRADCGAGCFCAAEVVV